MTNDNNRVVLISAFGYYDNRLKYVEKYYLEKGMSVTVIVSDFSHANKKCIENKAVGLKYIHAKEYNKNLSFARIFSHMDFAKNVLAEVVKLAPAIVYSIIPPNSLAKQLVKYKKKSGCKLYFDIFDMWPETMPVPKIIKMCAFIPFKYWSDLRDKSLVHADKIYLESVLYKDTLKKKVRQNCQSLPLVCENAVNEISKIEIDKTLELGYIGSINNIIDIDVIASLVCSLNNIMRTRVHVIGNGEKSEEFVSALENAGAEVIFYGPIYDVLEKQSILLNCHYGINIMKETVLVGLTMKSMEYFSVGLPLLNNIKGETWGFVENYGVGYNINSFNIILNT